MIMHRNHNVVDCPICGRPVENQQKPLALEKTCRHCHRRFVASPRLGCATQVATREEHSHLKRAEEILKVSARPRHQPQTVILVEHRDEVFARLATDIEPFGLAVIRAESVDAAMTIVRRCDSPLLIANRDLPGQNAWVLADKLKFTAPHVEVWLYMPAVSMYAEVLARLLKVQELFTYGGKLFTLSDHVVQRLADRCSPNAVQETQKFAAA